MLLTFLARVSPPQLSMDTLQSATIQSEKGRQTKIRMQSTRYKYTRFRGNNDDVTSMPTPISSKMQSIIRGAGEPERS